MGGSETETPLAEQHEDQDGLSLEEGQQQELTRDPDEEEGSPWDPEKIYDIREPDEEQEPSGKEEAQDETEPSGQEEGTEEKDEGEAEKPQFDQVLLDRARDAGVPDEHLAYFTPEALESLLDQKDKAKDSDSEPPKDDLAYEIELDKDEFDDALVAELGKMSDHYAGKIKEMRAVVQQLWGFAKMQASEAFQDRMDKQISDLGSEWESVFGKGSGRKLDPKSKDFANRVKLMQRMDTIAKSEKGLDDAQLVKQAAMSLFSDKADERARKKIASSLDKRKSQMLSRATDRSSVKSVSAEEDAKAFARDFFKERVQEEEEKDGL